MKINTLINSIKSKRKELYDDEKLKNATKEDYEKLDKFIIDIMTEYQDAYCSEEEDADFAYYLVLLEMDRAKLYSMVK